MPNQYTIHPLHKNNFQWTAHHVATLRRLWLEGHSVKEIVSRMSRKFNRKFTVSQVAHIRRLKGANWPERKRGPRLPGNRAASWKNPKEVDDALRAIAAVEARMAREAEQREEAA